MDNTTLQALIQSLAQNAQTSQQNAQSFSDMLKQRRQFVQAAEDRSADTALNAIQNGGVGGVRIDPITATDPLVSFHTDNANKTAELSQQAFGYQNQANDVLKGIADILNTQQGQNLQQQQLNLQKRGQDLQYGLTDEGTGTGVSGRDAITKVIQQGGSDILNQAPDDIGKMRLAQAVLKSGGVGQYHKQYNTPLPSGDQEMVHQTNDTLQQISVAEKQIKGSKALQSILGQPAKTQLAQAALKSGQTWLLHAMGLSSDDVNALGALVGLAGSGDRQLIGGRLTGYLSDKFGLAFPGVDKNPQDNLKILDRAKKSIVDNLNGYAKQHGYTAYADIPGINIGSSQDDVTSKLKQAGFNDAQITEYKQQRGVQ